MITEQITLGNLLGTAITATMSISTLLMVGRKVRRENQADSDARMLPVKTDIKVIQDKIADFMPRTEIERADAAVMAVAREATRDIVELKVAHGRLEQAYEGVKSDVGEIKALVKENGRDTVTRFDKLQDCMTEINRKVG